MFALADQSCLLQTKIFVIADFSEGIHCNYFNHNQNIQQITVCCKSAIENEQNHPFFSSYLNSLLNFIASSK